MENLTLSTWVCALLTRVVSARYALHEHNGDDHLYTRWIVQGVREPEARGPSDEMQLTMIGARSGERTVTVKRVGVGPVIIDEISYTGLVELEYSGTDIMPGDSGAPCLYNEAPGIYKMSCIFFADNGSTPNRVWAFPASKAQSKLGITFGKRPPVANAGPDQTVNSGAPVTLDGSLSSDPDGEPLTHLWEQIPEYDYEGTAYPMPEVVLKNKASKITMFNAPKSSEQGRLSFKLTATDVAGQTHSDTVNVNRKPIAKIVEPATVDVGERVNLDGSDSSDPDGDTLSYLWEQDRGPEDGLDTPAVTIENKTSKIAMFNVPQSSERGRLSFKLTVKDSRGATNSDTVNVNRNPIAKIAPLANVVVGTEGIVLDGSGSFDPDGDTLTYQWKQETASQGPEGIPPTVALSSATQASPTFTAPAKWTGNLSFTLTVRDDRGGTDSATVDIAVSELTDSWQNTGKTFIFYDAWSPWSDTGKTRNPGSVQWGIWKDTGQTSGEGPNEQKEQKRTGTQPLQKEQVKTRTCKSLKEQRKTYGDSVHIQLVPSTLEQSKLQWVPDSVVVEETQWVATTTLRPDDWRRTDDTRIVCGPWTRWTDTGKTRGDGPQAQKEQTRTRLCQTQRKYARGSGPREQVQWRPEGSPTPDTQTQWVADHTTTTRRPARPTQPPRRAP